MSAAHLQKKNFFSSRLAPGTPGIPTWDSVRTPFRNQPLRLAPAQEKILLESTSGDFFGFNTTSFSNRGVLGGIRDSLTGIYDNIVKDYVTDVYTDVIEGYTIATIKLMGWFFFGGFLLAKGALINSIVNSGGKVKCFLSPFCHFHFQHPILS